MFSQEEHIQYSRHFLLSEIGASGQTKLKNTKVLVIGAGGLGCPILQYLAAAGIGTLGIIDHDTIDQTNLQRQILYTYADIGQSKAITAAKRLSSINPFIEIIPYNEKLTSKNAIILFEQYDIIVDGSDNFSTRYLVNDAAVLTNKPLVFGSIFKFEGQVSVFNFKKGPTYRCLYPEPPKAGTMLNCSDVGVLGVLPGIIGCLQANEVLKISCELDGVLSGKLLSFNALTLQQIILKLSKNENIKINALVDYDVFCGVALPENEIDFLTLEKNKSAYNLLDVRTYEEREANHIGGIHIPLNELSHRLDEVVLDKPLVVYCQSGMRSVKAIEILQEEFLDIHFLNLKNGMSGVG